MVINESKLIRMKRHLSKEPESRRETGNFRHKLVDKLLIGLCVIIIGDKYSTLLRSLNAWLGPQAQAGGREINMGGKTIRGSGKPREHEGLHIAGVLVGEQESVTPGFAGGMNCEPLKGGYCYLLSLNISSWSKHLLSAFSWNILLQSLFGISLIAPK